MPPQSQPVRQSSASNGGEKTPVGPVGPAGMLKKKPAQGGATPQQQKANPLEDGFMLEGKNIANVKKEETD